LLWGADRAISGYDLRYRQPLIRDKSKARTHRATFERQAVTDGRSRTCSRPFRNGTASREPKASALLGEGTRWTTKGVGPTTRCWRPAETWMGWRQVARRRLTFLAFKQSFLSVLRATRDVAATRVYETGTLARPSIEKMLTMVPCFRRCVPGRARADQLDRGKEVHPEPVRTRRAVRSSSPVRHRDGSSTPVVPGAMPLPGRSRCPLSVAVRQQ
jgi:hypothetical protein